MKLANILEVLEAWAPLALQEDYDNAGLITGNPEMEISSALICLDSTETVIDEAIQQGCNLIIAHHPIVFSGLKKFNGKNYVERALIKAIKNDIAIYAIHTNLDNTLSGVNSFIAEKLNLKNTRILAPVSGNLRKLFTYITPEHADKLRDALFEAGAGSIGNYDRCSFNTEGNGTFRGNEISNPKLGEKGEWRKEKEIKIEVLFPAHLEGKILAALRAAHHYEEIAYEIIALQNKDQTTGAGLTGELQQSQTPDSFLAFVAQKMNCDCIRYTKSPKQTISKVALCGGSGSFLLQSAIQSGSDVLLTSDFKYHQFFDADDKIMILDIGHYESEQFTINGIGNFLRKKFPTFALRFSETNTNPIQYFHR